MNILNKMVEMKDVWCYILGVIKGGIMISHYRVDMRVVHGQTTTILKKTFPLDNIIVIDDEIAADPYMGKLYASTVSSNIKVFILNTERGFVNLKKAEDSKFNYFIIFKTPVTVKKLIDMGYTFKGTLTIGRQFIRDNAPKYLPSLGNTKEEWEALEYIHEKGVDIVFDPSCIFENISFETAKEAHDKVVY